MESKIINLSNITVICIYSTRSKTKAPVSAQFLNHVRLFETPWTVARQTPLSIEFSRKEYWSGLPIPIPGDLLDPGIEPEFPASPVLQTDSLLLNHWGSPPHIP